MNLRDMPSYKKFGRLFDELVAEAQEEIDAGRANSIITISRTELHHALVLFWQDIFTGTKTPNLFLVRVCVLLMINIVVQEAVNGPEKKN